MSFFKDTFKLMLNQLSPKLYIEFIKSRYFVINNLNIYAINNYNSKGTFPTMWDNPPRHYKKWIKSLVLNDEGVPMHAPDGSNQISAVPIIQYGLCEYGYYTSTNENKHFDEAIRIADWLVINQAENGGWLYNYDYFHPRAEETIKGPWICGMAQGEGVGFLSRIYHLTGVEKYKACAERALQPFEVKVEDGGVLRHFNGLPFYEEYPTPTKGTLTINGFMFCLIGLYDYYILCQSEKAKILFEQGYESLIQLLPYYDSENMSYYDLSHITNSPRKPHPAGKYDPIHVMLLQVLNVINPNVVLSFYANKWSWGLLSEKRLAK